MARFFLCVHNKNCPFYLIKLTFCLMNRLRYKFYELYAKYHLKYSCPGCPEERREKRDIFKEGECFWYKNWTAGKYDIRSYQTYILFKKFGIEKDLFLK